MVLMVPKNFSAQKQKGHSQCGNGLFALKENSL
jgi:hypothetical protein